MARKTKKSILASVMAPAAEGVAGALVEDHARANDSIIQPVAIDSKKLMPEETVAESQYSDLQGQSDVDDLTDEIHNLINENNELKDKLASYIKDLENANIECKKLRSEYDDVLVKISDMSFENALLKSKVEELEKTQNAATNTILKPIEVRQSTSVPYMHQPKCNRNGYTDWN